MINCLKFNSLIQTATSPELSSELPTVVKGPCVSLLAAANTSAQGLSPGSCAPAAAGCSTCHPSWTGTYLRQGAGSERLQSYTSIFLLTLRKPAILTTSKEKYRPGETRHCRRISAQFIGRLILEAVKSITVHPRVPVHALGLFGVYRKSHVSVFSKLKRDSTAPTPVASSNLMLEKWGYQWAQFINKKLLHFFLQQYFTMCNSEFSLCSRKPNWKTILYHWYLLWDTSDSLVGSPESPFTY